jgi:hypothetical protein
MMFSPLTYELISLGIAFSSALLAWSYLRRRSRESRADLASARTLDRRLRELREEWSRMPEPGKAIVPIRPAPEPKPAGTAPCPLPPRHPLPNRMAQASWPSSSRPEAITAR